MVRQRDVEDDDVREDDDAPSRNRRIAIVAGAALALITAVVATVLVVRQQQEANAPTYTVTTRLVELPTTASVVPASFACPTTGRGPAPWTSAVKPSSSSGAGSGQLVAALMTVAAPPNADAATDVATTVWMSIPTAQSKVGLDQDVALCAFVDTGALASNLDQSTEATASAEQLANVAELGQKKAGAAYAVDVKGLEPGRSATVVMIGRLAPFDGAASGQLEVKTLEVAPSAPGARVTPGGRDGRLTIGDASDESSVALSLDSDRELWTRGQPVTVRMRLGNTHADATVGSVTSTLRYDPGLSNVEVKVADGIGAPTVCTAEGAVSTCKTDYLAPGEEVTLTLTATVAADAPTQFTAKGSSCPARNTDVCVRASISELSGEGREWATANLAGNVAADTVLGITKLPSGVSDHVRAGELTRFVYLVTASAGESMKTVQLADPGCPTPNFVSGDNNLNEILDGGETWQYECIAPAPRDADVEITVSGVSVREGATVKASGQLAVPVYDPKMELSEPAPGQPTVNLVNTGNVTLRGVVLTGRGCEVSADQPLAPGATLQVPCRAATGALRAFGVDPSGEPVTTVLEATTAG